MEVRTQDEIQGRHGISSREQMEGYSRLMSLTDEEGL